MEPTADWLNAVAGKQHAAAAVAVVPTVAAEAVADYPISLRDLFTVCKDSIVWKKNSSSFG